MKLDSKRLLLFFQHFILSLLDAEVRVRAGFIIVYKSQSTAFIALLTRQYNVIYASLRYFLTITWF